MGDRNALNKNAITSHNFIICTGAKTHVPQIVGLKKVLPGDPGWIEDEGTPYHTYDTIFDELGNLPARLAIVGAGAGGCELAQCLARLGTDVTIVGENFLPRVTADVRNLIFKKFKEEGITYLKGKVEGARPQTWGGGKGIGVALVNGKEVCVDAVLIAAGRKPALKTLRLDKAKVKFTDEGIIINKYGQTSTKHIYAAGDCVAGEAKAASKSDEAGKADEASEDDEIVEEHDPGLQLTHYAKLQARNAIRNMLFTMPKEIPDIIPEVIFTDPEIARAGLTEEAAKEEHEAEELMVLYRKYDTMDRPILEGTTNGFIKLVCLKTGKILGCSLCGPGAGEMLAELVFAMTHDMPLAKLAESVHAYPVLGFALMQMAEDVALTALAGSPPPCMCCMPPLQGKKNEEEIGKFERNMHV